MTDLLRRQPHIIAAGASLLADAVAGQAAQVTRVEWAPPMPGTEADLVTVLADARRPSANSRAVERMLAARAQLVDVVQAGPALGLGPGEFLHAGPPISWERASGPLRGALMGAAVFEGLVSDPDAAESESALRIVGLEPCHHRGSVGPMAGVVSPSMWVFVLEDPSDGRRAYCSLNEGLGKVLRYGAYSADVIERLRWMSAVLGPLLQAAVRRHGPVDITAILTQMVQMGDEAHNRNRAGTLMLLRDLLPSMVESGFASSDVADSARFIAGNDHFFLNLAMPACKLALDAARDIPGSTMLVAMARNGTDFGIQVSGTGSQWFTAPALVPEGLFLAGYGPADANPDIGDSAITETAGLGGFAMAAAPAIVRLVGGTAAAAVAATRRMYEITLAEHPLFGVPALEFRGTPAGIDATLVARTQILPQINTGMAGKVAGTGQVGAGLVTPPAEVFPLALRELAARAAAHAATDARLGDRQDGSAGDAVGREVGQGLVGRLQRIRGHGDLEPQPFGEAEELLGIPARVRGHAAQVALLEQLVFVVQRRDVGQVDARDRDRSAAVEVTQRGRHDRAHWREHNRRVERLWRGVERVLRRGDPEFQCELARGWSPGEDVHGRSACHSDLGGQVR
jgi:hypothetical protein